MAYNAMKMVCTTRIASIGSASEASSHSFSPISAIAGEQRQAYVTQHGYRTLKDAVKAHH